MWEVRDRWRKLSRATTMTWRLMKDHFSWCSALVVVLKTEILEFYCNFKPCTITYRSMRRLLLMLFTSQIITTLNYTDDRLVFTVLSWKQRNLRWKRDILFRSLETKDYLKDLYRIYFLFIFESAWPQLEKQSVWANKNKTCCIANTARKLSCGD